ncbi:hypothetical protein [Natranaerofaba carboxydovora]|uniref:hypothetical protein n=1 Tax=Natranaerofaba carboxydovora TaxID=2742683 RepID=UPI001F1312AD|nr:hypothetical protein [Natranaerofaba carboxydovora]UMZ73621.1 hypothetical protein ACONDI_01184 [Natranaerofaba carboxydovora]
MTIKLGIDKKGEKVEFDLEENNNICIVGNVKSDKVELAKKIMEQFEGSSIWFKPGDEFNVNNEDGLVVIEDVDNLEESKTLKEIIDHPTKTIIITTEFDEETIPDNIIKNIDIFFIGYIRSVANYPTQRLKLTKSTMYLDNGEFIVSRENQKERKINIEDIG